jgi:hypothetical protein
MKRFLGNKKTKGLWFITILLFWASLLSPKLAAAGGPSGLSLNLYVKKDAFGNPVLRYTLGDEQDKIPLIIVIKNESKWPINTDLGFSQVECDQYLTLTDSKGKKFTALIEEKLAPEMPPPLFWKQWETVPAEVLEVGWERTVLIDDLRKIFPTLEKRAGWITVQSEIPFSRYGWTIKTGQGLMGVMDNKAFHGTVKSKKLRFFVAPARGAQLRIRVEDLSTPDNPFRSHVPVKIFRRSDLPQEYNLEAVWKNFDPVLEGKSNPQGWASIPCLSEPANGDSYVAIGNYKDEYKEVYFEPGGDGWKSDCGGLLERYILFQKPPQQFSVFGLCSVWLRNKVRIESGDIGANIACAGPWLVPEFEVSVAENVYIADAWQIKGDSVQIRSTASVYEVFYNELDNRGTIRFHDNDITYTPLPLPIWSEVEDLFPKGNAFKASKDNVIVDSSLHLPPGEYNDVILGSNKTLILTGGEYDFMNLELGSESILVCENPTTIRIKERIYPGTKAFLGPQATSTVTARDITIFVNGTNGKKGGLNDKPKAAHIGEGNTVKANIYAKNGTLLIEEGCILEGSFIAKDVSIGQKSVINFNGAF